jgi:UDP-N-acetylmuramoyl-tripeptide--D-alanyl-D-alanine ligase
MRDWDARHLAAAAGATLVRAPSGELAPGALGRPGPLRASVDTRTLAPGELFVGLRGENADGGTHAARALAAGAWGVLVAPEHAQAAVAASGAGAPGVGSGGADVAAGAAGPPDVRAPGAAGAVLSHPDPLAALHALARGWRRELRVRGAMVVAVTGSTGKTSTKDILAALLGERLRVASSPENLNTEIGLPLALLAAAADTELLVLEMAMRGAGQIAELTAIAEPDVGVIVNVGPAHLELLGTLEAIAAAKAELIAGLAPGASVVVPTGERLLAKHLRADVTTIGFGEGGEVSLAERRVDGSVLIRHGECEIELWPSFSQAHNLSNLLAAVAAARALGYTPMGRLDVRFSAMRGQRLRLPGGVVAVADCYNANPMSMRAAIDELCETAPGRRVAVLGDMLELGPEGPRMHRDVGAHAGARGVDMLVAVGPLAAEMRTSFRGESHAVADAQAAGELLDGLLRDGDTVLVKGSRGVGLEAVLERLGAGTATPADDSPEAAARAAPRESVGSGPATAVGVAAEQR